MKKSKAKTKRRRKKTPARAPVVALTNAEHLSTLTSKALKKAGELLSIDPKMPAIGDEPEQLRYHIPLVQTQARVVDSVLRTQVGVDQNELRARASNNLDEILATLRETIPARQERPALPAESPQSGERATPTQN